MVSGHAPQNPVQDRYGLAYVGALVEHHAFRPLAHRSVAYLARELTLGDATPEEDESIECRLVPLSQVLFGSDYPYLAIDQDGNDLASVKLSEAQLDAIERSNALTLLPRFAGISFADKHSKPP